MVEPAVLAQRTGVGPGGVFCRKCCPGDVASWPPCRPHLLCRDCLAQLPPPHSTFVLPHISISLRHGASALLVLKHFSCTRRRLSVSRRIEAACHGIEKRNWVGSERICAVSWQMEGKWGLNEETGPDSIDRILPKPEDSLLLKFAYRLEAGDLPF